MLYRPESERKGYEKGKMRKRAAACLIMAAVIFLLAACQEGNAKLSETWQAQSGEKENSGLSTAPEKLREITEEVQNKIAAEQSGPIKGIYVTGPMAGHKNMENLIQLVRESELNAMVIDIKNDEGIITYEMEDPMVQELGASAKYIADLPGLLKRLKEEDVYCIARITAFKDPLLASKRPDLCIQRKDGGVFTDKNGLAWVNPYRQEVWEYLMAIAEQAAALGFDEIQFDYIRFPTEIADEEADYGEGALDKSKTDVITEFTAYAYEHLSPLGVKVSADVFGTVIDQEIDAEIVGQDYPAMAEHLDYICPMIYPSHYNDGVYGLEHPDLQPYETICAALEASRESLSGIPEDVKKAEVRPWLQDFTASWLSVHQDYGPEQLRQQIQAVYDSGCTEWILWNAKNVYTADGLLSPEEAAEEMKALAEEAEE